MKQIKISPDKLPIHIEFDSSQGKKDYILKTGKEKNTLILIKKEY